MSGRIGGDSPEGSRFPFWSFSKKVIAICALRLADEHLVDLDVADMEHLFPLRDLLRHTSGLPDNGSLKSITPLWPAETSLGPGRNYLQRSGL